MHAKSNPGMLTLDHGLSYQYALVDIKGELKFFAEDAQTRGHKYLTP